MNPAVAAVEENGAGVAAREGPVGASTEGSTGKGWTTASTVWTTAWTGWRSVWSRWRSAWSGVKDATLDSPILPDPGRAEVLIEDPGVSEESQ
jgi:hypothetical protein